MRIKLRGGSGDGREISVPDDFSPTFYLPVSMRDGPYYYATLEKEAYYRCIPEERTRDGAVIYITEKERDIRTRASPMYQVVKDWTDDQWRDAIRGDQHAS